MPETSSSDIGPSARAPDDPPPRSARALWITGARQAEIRETALPRPAEGDVVVRTLYSGISRGTESLVFSGRTPESQWRAMRAPMQEGDLPFPVKYGYVAVGIVRSGQPDLLGRTVFCLHPHQEWFAAPASMVHPVPEDVPAERAVLAANAETAITIVWDAGVGVGDRVAVIGAGVVGCLVAWLAARTPGTSVHLVDPDAAKAAAARTLGARLLSPEAAQDLPPQDVVIHTSADPAGLRQALSLADVEAKIVEASWYGTTEPALPLGEAFHSKRLTIRSSQVGRLPPDRAPRWSLPRRMALALDLLADPALDVLITGESAFEDLPSTLEALTDDSAGVLMHRIRYDGIRQDGDGG